MKDGNIIAAGIEGRWYISAPKLFIGSLLGFLFWSAVIAAAKQIWMIL